MELVLSKEGGTASPLKNFWTDCDPRRQERRPEGRLRAPWSSSWAFTLEGRGARGRLGLAVIPLRDSLRGGSVQPSLVLGPLVTHPLRPAEWTFRNNLKD